MEHVNLGSVIEQVISRFRQNRIGEKPLVFVTVSSPVSHVPWRDRALKEFVRMFLYESLLTNGPDAPIEIALRKQIGLKDLNKFVGVQPSYWVQLRVSGRGLKLMERAIEELFGEVGYRCQEWVGVEDSSTRLGIFGAVDDAELKLVFCLELSRNNLKCDLLIPASDPLLLPKPATEAAKHPH